MPLGEASRFGILALDENGRVTEWQEKPRQPKSDLASLGIYVFSKRSLLTWLDDQRVDFGHDVIPAMLDGGARVFGYQFDGYWQDVGTVDGYWQAHMDLLEEHPGLDLYDKRLAHPHALGGACTGAHRADRLGPSLADQPRLPDLGHG